MTKSTVIVIPGLFGGVSKKYYRPLAKMLGSDDFLLLRAGSDWEPKDIAKRIRQIEGHKILICLSCGAIVGNILATDDDVEVYYICPYIGVNFINRKEKICVYKLRHFFRGLASVLMAITKPFKWHRWYPLYGGTKPDGWFLSVYAICKQFKYAFGEIQDINTVDGTILSYGDNVVEPTAAIKTSSNVIVAMTAGKSGPSHVNLRAEGEKFGAIRSDVSDTDANMSEDAEAYLTAFAEIITRRPQD